MAKQEPLEICRNCKKNKVKKHGHTMCYQCNKKINPKQQKGKR